MRNFFQTLTASLRNTSPTLDQNSEVHNRLVGLIDEVEVLLERKLGGTRGLLGVDELVLAFEGVCTAVIDAPVAVSPELFDRLTSLATELGADRVMAELATITPNDPNRAWMTESTGATESTAVIES